jgi:hypothetical protein
MECWEEAKASLNFLTFLLAISKCKNTQFQETVFFMQVFAAGRWMANREMGGFREMCG